MLIRFDLTLKMVTVGKKVWQQISEMESNRMNCKILKRKDKNSIFL